MKQTVLALMFALAVVPLVSAHEGHDHKIMGTVSALQANHLEVKGTDGKTSTFTLTDATKVIRGKVAMTTADLKTGGSRRGHGGRRGKGTVGCEGGPLRRRSCGETDDDDEEVRVSVECFLREGLSAIAVARRERGRRWPTVRSFRGV